MRSTRKKEKTGKVSWNKNLLIASENNKNIKSIGVKLGLKSCAFNAAGKKKLVSLLRDYFLVSALLKGTKTK